MSDAPGPPGSAVPGAGRSRAGNAMARTRVAVLAGARQSLIAHGSKTTMVDIALTSGVAKATLYNHFRTRSEVFAALIEHEIVTAGAETAALAEGAGVVVALSQLAERVGQHPVVRRLAATEPAALSLLLLPEQAGSGAASWTSARDALAVLLDAAAVELVLRYLVSQLLWPASRADIETALPVLLTAGTPGSGTGPVVGPALEPVAEEPAAGTPRPAVPGVSSVTTPAVAPEVAPEVAPVVAPEVAPVVVAHGTAPGLGFPLPVAVLERVGF